MIVISFVLVIVAAVALVIGLFQDTLAPIWTAIASSVVAMIFLGVGVVQRRTGQVRSEETGYGPGAPAGQQQRTAAPRAEEEREEAPVGPGRGPAGGGSPFAPPEPAAPERPPAGAGRSGSTAARSPTTPLRKATTRRAAPAAAGEATTGPAARAALSRVKGLGPAKQQALLDRFGSLEAIRAASVEELTAVKGVGERIAREIHGELS
jgi:predicted flap endonuclease-1-like 5' DNA nuclease